MKSFLNVAKLSFLIIGGIVGAGFLSGRELLTFFGSGNFTLNCFLSLTFLGVLFFLVIQTEERVENKGVNAALFEESKLNDCFCFFSLSICLVSMLAGLNALFKIFFNIDTALVSLITIIGCFFLSKTSVKKIEVVNFILTFCSIALLFFCLIEKREFDFSSQAGTNIVSPLSFTFINFYLCLPIFLKSGKGKSKREKIIALVLSLIVLLIMALLIYGAINSCGLNGRYLDLPIFAYTSGKLKIVVAITLFCGILSSTLISYYSAVKVFKKEKSGVKIIIYSLCLVAISKISLTNVVNYLYPLIGAFGVLYAIKCVVFLLKCIKRKRKANNIIKS